MRGGKSHISRRPLTAERLLFPLAALYAFAAPLLWLALRERLPGVIDMAWHGHEMLFGYALAVLAGFLATRPRPGGAWVLAGAWLAGRIAAASAGGPAAFLTGMLFPLAVFLAAAPPLFGRAKRGENRILPALLATLVVADAAWWAGAAWFGPPFQSRALLAGLDLFALLLLLVGGRALRAAAGGHLERRGIPRRDHGQPRYELPLAGLAGGAALADALAAGTLAGVLCLLAATLALVRVMPWQLRHTVQQPQLWALALGYLWLVPGLVLKGLAQLAGEPPLAGMLHGIGMGALGTLTLVMMARTATLRARRPVTEFGDIGAAALLIGVAALARLLAAWLPAARDGLLWLAALLWACAFGILLLRLWRTPQPARG